MSSRRSGIGLGTCLLIMFAVFLALRLFGVVDWKWYIVAIPIWIYFAIIIFALVILLIVGLVDSRTRYSRIDDVRGRFYQNLNPDELQEALMLECSPDQLNSDPYAKSIMAEINRIRKCDKQNNKNIRKLIKHWR